MERPDNPALTARTAGLVACRVCTKVHPGGTEICDRCGAELSSRKAGALGRVWAWLIAGMIVYIPANIEPMLRTTTLFETHEATILGGAVDLAQSGAYGVALIVFVASIVIPVSKFIAIGYLALATGRADRMTAHGRHRLYEVVEFIGRWSMIDVFVVAILSALVQLSTVVTINPGIASASFALSVAFTMLAAQSFDPRTIWDLDDSSAP